MNNVQDKNKDIKYAKFLSSLFCFISIVTLTLLCLLNNQSMDLYSMFFLLKIVIPASFSFWFMGLIVGKIFDAASESPIKKIKLSNDNKAYEIPSIFGSSNNNSTEEINDEV